MKVLAIETSCDETALALLDGNGDSVGVCAEVISSQIKMHQEYGGVVPELAARSHLEQLPLLLREVLKQGGWQLGELDAIAVTQGPGLKGCLLMGVGFAKGLAISTGKKYIGVNHIEGHTLAPMLDNPELQPPFLALVVSGGHTEIVLVKDIGEYEILARTIDDAAGEAFDKSAHLLGIPYPGGPTLAALADTVSGSSFILPKVMRGVAGFSFSGLKTAILQVIRKNSVLLEDPAEKASLCWAIQDAILDTLCNKLELAIKQTGVRKVTVTGGVSANLALRKRVQQLTNQVFFPEFKHCTDNAAMIGYVALQRLIRNKAEHYNGQVFARWPIEDL